MIYFTKIKWAGSEAILVTEEVKPILILDANEIDKLINEWKSKRE